MEATISCRRARYKKLSRQETPNSVCEVCKEKVERSRRIGVQRGDGGDEVKVGVSECEREESGRVSASVSESECG